MPDERFSVPFIRTKLQRSRLPTRQYTQKRGALAAEKISELIQAQQEGDIIEPEIPWGEPWLSVRGIP